MKIRRTESLSDAAPETEAARGYDAMIEDLLEGPYWIVDILPGQVPAQSSGQYFAVERYYRQAERLKSIRRRYAEILLRLNCYYDMAVSFDSCASWETNPDPERFVGRVAGLSGNEFLRTAFFEQKAMIDYDHNDTCMTVYDPESLLLPKIRALAAAEGFFVWTPPQVEP